MTTSEIANAIYMAAKGKASLMDRHRAMIRVVREHRLTGRQYADGMRELALNIDREPSGHALEVLRDMNPMTHTQLLVYMHNQEEYLNA